ncbi:MAG: endo alpha-1,4 polygalactosaminidase [Actinomycetota bacterium]
MRTRGIAVAFACLLIVGVLATAADARSISSSAAPRPVRLIDPTPCGGCWHPAQKVSWQWQLHNPPTASALLDVKMYDVDGFDASKTLIAAMHARGIKAVCYISAGSWENWRPDAGDFPAADLGKSNGWPGERWLDIRDLAGLGPIMSARLDICRRKGFDAVEFDNVDGFQNGTGFPLKGAEQLRYNIFLANEAHARGMSAFLKNDIDQVKTLLPYFDAELNEQCFQYAECGKIVPFVDAGKPVFSVEYKLDAAQFCPKANAKDFNALKKKLALDAWRVACRGA